MSTTIGRVPRLERRPLGRRAALRKTLLACGIGYGLAYAIVNDVIAAGMWDSYSPMDQAISELSGTEAPSRDFLRAMLPLFVVLVFLFGVGVWQSAGKRRSLRAVGGILMAQGLLFPLWLLFPMTSREALAEGAGGANDIGHLVLSVLAISFIVTEMGISGAALGKRFRYFSITMVLLTLLAGGYVGTTTSAVAAGDPTPWMGFVERISYGAWLVWMAGLAVVLMSEETTTSDRGTGSGNPSRKGLLARAFPLRRP